MSLTVRTQSVLLFVDFPQIIVAHDAIGTNYICLLTERSKDKDKYVCIPISTKRLADLRSGDIDLRKVFTSPELDGIYIAEIVGSDAPINELELKPTETLIDEWLPEEGFYLPDFQQDWQSDSKVIVEEALGRNRAVVHLRIDPPESRDDSKIDVVKLAQGLLAFQNLVKYAYRSAMRSLPDNIKHMIMGEDNYMMEAFAFSPGSFKIHMQSKEAADLSGYSNLVRALKIVDGLTKKIDSPKDAFEDAKNNRGHIISAYQNLLKYLYDNRSPLEYRWVMPSNLKPITRRITPEDAKDLYDLLVTREELAIEEIKFTGVFKKVDVTNGIWSLRSDEDGKEYRGSIAPGNNITLSGVIMDTQRYNIVCEEKIEETAGSGRQSTKLLMRTINEISVPK